MIYKYLIYYNSILCTNAGGILIKTKAANVNISFAYMYMHRIGSILVKFSFIHRVCSVLLRAHHTSQFFGGIVRWTWDPIAISLHMKKHCTVSISTTARNGRLSFVHTLKWSSLVI